MSDTRDNTIGSRSIHPDDVDNDGVHFMPPSGLNGAPPAGGAASVDSSVSSLAPNTISVPPPTPSQAFTPDQVRDEFSHLKSNSFVDVSKLQILLKDYDSLKEKVGKLKSLLGRSAKAQREAKVELDSTQKRLDASLREIDRLNKKIDKLANRPTHMELLADFESNFDRALLQIGPSIASQHQQAGGQDTASAASSAAIALAHPSMKEDTVVDGLLMQELSDSKHRVDKLENLNSALVHRSSQLEAELLEQKRERDELLAKLSHTELEKRMAVLEAEHATKAMQASEASLQEMQLEIDLVTKASAKVNARAAQGEQLMKAVKTDKQHVQQLEAKVQALQEWALASSEAKTLAQERVRLLETQLRSLQLSAAVTGSAPEGSLESPLESDLFTKSASLVVGAGDTAVRVFSLTPEQARTVRLSERVVLRWKLDLTQDDATIDFSLMQAECETPAKRKAARYLIKDRLIKGGAAGETENAFILENTCTLSLSNGKAWIRPKTVKYSIEAVVLAY
jgi:myosin heavy subunit